MAQHLKCLRNLNTFRSLCTQTSKTGGFAQAYDKFTELPNEKKEEAPKENVPFATLLRNSKFIDVSKT